MATKSHKRKGNIQTVDGLISPENMGITLAHEHLQIDISDYFKEPKEKAFQKAAYEPLSIDTVGYFRYHWHNNRDDMKLLDEDMAIKEISVFKRAGGKTVIDATNRCSGRNPAALQRIARKTGLHVVMGSGYYIKLHQKDPALEKRSVEEITEEFIKDIQVGADGTEICSGFVGEIGISYPIFDTEKKILRAGGFAQKETGAALVIHPGVAEESPKQILEILKETSADLAHTAIIHIDRTLFNPENRYRLAEAGCWLEYDAFGLEGYWPESLKPVDIINDSQRIRQIKDLMDHGFGDQILIGTDIAHKARYMQFGGHGYGHILLNVVPAMRARGFDDGDIQKLLIENPKRFFAFR
jgi:phosphotriesterase-related protein